MFVIASHVAQDPTAGHVFAQCMGVIAGIASVVAGMGFAASKCSATNIGIDNGEEV